MPLIYSIPLATLALLSSAKAEQLLTTMTDAESEAPVTKNPWFPDEWRKHIDDNKTPVIGILTQTLESFMKKEEQFKGYKSYLMSAYVKYIEASGARVVPLIYGEDQEVTRDKISKLDGILFPGGGGDDYALGQFVFEEVKKLNDAGHFYPLWGTCLGYENLVTYVADKGKAALDKIEVDGESLKLEFLADPLKYRMYQDLGKDAYEFTKNGFTYNNHEFAVKRETFQEDKALNSFWNVSALSTNPNDGTPFVASIEAKNYPIYATQFHPEKPSELWVDGVDINHSWESIQLQEHFGKFFVEMARANPNTFGDFATTQKLDISNYDIRQTSEVADAYVFK